MLDGLLSSLRDPESRPLAVHMAFVELYTVDSSRYFSRIQQDWLPDQKRSGGEMILGSRFRISTYYSMGPETLLIVVPAAIISELVLEWINA